MVEHSIHTYVHIHVHVLNCQCLHLCRKERSVWAKGEGLCQENVNRVGTCSGNVVSAAYDYVVLLSRVFLFHKTMLILAPVALHHIYLLQWKK